MLERLVNVSQRTPSNGHKASNKHYLTVRRIDSNSKLKSLFKCFSNKANIYGYICKNLRTRFVQTIFPLISTKMIFVLDTMIANVCL